MTDYIPENMQQAFIRATIVNSSSDLFPAETGSATDIALLKFVHRCKKDISASRQACEITRNIPFSSTRKRMSVMIKEEGQVVHYIKGASEIILESCSAF
jgi:Ca2+ transporting ATPase